MAGVACLVETYLWLAHEWASHNTGSLITDDEFDAEGHELACLLSEELKYTMVYED